MRFVFGINLYVLTAVYIYEGNNWGVVERKFTFPNE